MLITHWNLYLNSCFLFCSRCCDCGEQFSCNLSLFRSFVVRLCCIFCRSSILAVLVFGCLVRLISFSLFANSVNLLGVCRLILMTRGERFFYLIFDGLNIAFCMIFLSFLILSRFLLDMCFPLASALPQH